MSPSDVIADVEKKIDAFVANGVRVAVLLDPRSGTVIVSRPGAAPRTYTTALVEIGPEMPGFTLAAAAVFERSKGPGKA